MIVDEWKWDKIWVGWCELKSGFVRSSFIKLCYFNGWLTIMTSLKSMDESFYNNDNGNIANWMKGLKMAINVREYKLFNILNLNIRGKVHD